MLVFLRGEQAASTAPLRVEAQPLPLDLLLFIFGLFSVGPWRTSGILRRRVGDDLL